MYKQPRKQQVKCHPMMLTQNLHIPKYIPKDPGLYSLFEAQYWKVDRITKVNYSKGVIAQKGQ